MNLDIRTFTSMGWGENAYLVRCQASEGVSSGAVVIDPGGEAPMIADALEGEVLEAILLTHAHLDHIEGVAELKRRTDAPVYLHEADRPLYDRVAAQAAAFGVEVEEPPPPDGALADNQQIRFGGCSFEVRHVPGHSPGHVLFYAADAGVAFVGDIVFAGSIGRTDLPGGDYRQLLRGIRERVLSLPDDTRLYPGHGPDTNVGHERVGNPFLVPLEGGRMA
ncbi:MAG: MBL fold metallo-hydrolase [Gemmatimonadota bacterium]